jgi:hypothetical protein
VDDNRKTVPVPGLGEVRTDYLIAAAIVAAVVIGLRYSGLLARLDRATPLYQSAALGITLAPAVAGLFSAPNPSKMTIATFSSIPGHMKYWIHSGNREAVAQSFMMGLGVALLTGHWAGFAIIMGMAAWKVSSYEDALAGGSANGAPGYDMTECIRDDVRSGRAPADATA